MCCYATSTHKLSPNSYRYSRTVGHGNISTKRHLVTYLKPVIVHALKQNRKQKRSNLHLPICRWHHWCHSCRLTVRLYICWQPCCYVQVSSRRQTSGPNLTNGRQSGLEIRFFQHLPGVDNVVDTNCKAGDSRLRLTSLRDLVHYICTFTQPQNQFSNRPASENTNSLMT